ncbi:DUF4405 domain-containing protein [Paratractidigestivibacter sp.]|uniref:DUF4405 domain-containing protein n=1 Tax=Paratractidigestivibacter sp. TaxID=2847316 RepID=UPI002ACB0604|nr:DUF4405 domain-containing protein [Paratractidigestivibacter sp.]
MTMAQARGEKSKMWLFVDAAMTAAMPLLMAYALVGELAHECIGVAAGMLFVAHLWLNRRWIAALPKGRWTASRALGAAVTLGLALAIVVTMATGIATSRYLFAALAAHANTTLFEFVHLVGAYWAFTLSGIHLGLNWKRVIAASRRARGVGAGGGTGTGRMSQAAAAIATVAIAHPGLLTFFKRGAWRYLLGLAHYAPMDYAEPAWFYIADYLLIGALFVVIGHIAGAVATRLTKKRMQGNGTAAK